MGTSDDDQRAARRWKNVDPARSRTMSLVRGKDTAPEMIVRRLAHGMGYRYGLHCKDLPGRPDLVFRSRKKLILVHGCYWHSHPDPECRRVRLPKTRRKYWEAKIKRNAERDVATAKALRAKGWNVLTIWECETPSHRRKALAKKISLFLAQGTGRAQR